jgi:hypothetical protein
MTCAQLAGTFQEDADALTAWYSGWYNGLAKKHFLDYRKGSETEHEVICIAKQILKCALLKRLPSFSKTRGRGLGSK